MKLSLNSLRNRAKSILADIAKKVKVTHKLDYSKASILMCDNLRLNSCAKEPETVKWIETFGKDDVFVDIGANVGAYSLIASKYCKTVYSFEPSAFNFYVLVKNILANNAANIIPFNIALYKDKLVGKFSYGQAKEGGSGNTFLKSSPDNTNLQILSYTLDDFVEEFNLPKVDHIKLDVDGNEYEILEGATKLLTGVKSILVESDAERDNKIMALLAKMGLKKSQQHPLDYKYSNCIFVR